MLKKISVVCAVLSVTALIFMLIFGSCRKSTESGQLIYEHTHSYEEAWDGNETEHWHNASCGHAAKSNKEKHVFDESGYCLSCGYGSPETENGAVLKCSDGEHEFDSVAHKLIIEGLREVYTLSTDYTAVNLREEISVLLACSEEEGEPVVVGNYLLGVSLNGSDVEDLAHITREGTYAVTVSYDSGEGLDVLVETATFTVNNPLVGLRLENGVTEQIVSATDVISNSWVFVAVRANGETEEVDGSSVKISPLVTDTVGKRVAHVTLGELTGEVEYEILPATELVTDFSITPTEIVRETEEDGITFTADDFTASATVTGDYSLRIFIEDGGAEVEGFYCAADGVERKFTVVAEYAFIEGGRKIVKTFRSEISALVTRKLPVQDDGDFSVKEGEFADWVADMLESTVTVGNESVELGIAPQENFAVVCVDGALVIEATDGAFGSMYSGLTVNLKKSARITLTVYAVNGFAMLGVDDSDEFDEIYSEKIELTFWLEEGEHAFSFFAPSGTQIVICGITVEFD